MSTWFSDEALQLLEARNLRKVAAFSDLIASHQQLLFRSANVPSLTASLRLPSAQEQDDAAAQKYLVAIQRLEREVAEKNAQLASYVSQQLSLVSQSKILLQERDKREMQLQLATKRLDEETVLSLEKDKALKELEAALLIVREELSRHRVLLENSERETDRLRKRNAELEMQVQEKSVLLHEWIQGEEHPSSTLTAMVSQETAENMSHLLLNEEEGVGGTGPEAKLVTHVTHSICAHATEVNSVCFNSSGKILFSGSSDGTVRAWEAEIGALSSPRALGEYRGVGTAHPLLCVRASEDGALVLGTGCDRKCFV